LLSHYFGRFAQLRQIRDQQVVFSGIGKHLRWLVLGVDYQLTKTGIAFLHRSVRWSIATPVAHGLSASVPQNWPAAARKPAPSTSGIRSTNATRNP
jgi:hypothetical protein